MRRVLSKTWRGGSVSIAWRKRTSRAQIDRLALDEAAMADVTLSFLAVSGRVGKVPFTRSQLALAPFLTVLHHRSDTGKATADVHVLAARVFALAGRLAFE